MNRIVIQSRIDTDGILKVTLLVGTAKAHQEVRVTVEPVSASTLSPEEWRQRVLRTAGQWQGEFERSEQGEYQQREPLS